MLKIDAQTVLLVFIGLQITLMLFKARAGLWHYHSDKPFGWDNWRKRGNMTPALDRLEQASADKVRLYNFWFQVERLKREAVPGAFAELGVYKGETAELLHVLDPERPLYLFDTFEGFQAQDLALENSFGKSYKPGFFSDTELEAVQKRLGNSANLHYYPGYFPETTQELPEQCYALVHLDADLYWPTLQACRYFYARLSPGGVLIVHDYNHIWDGVRQALDEFNQTIPENLIEVADRQGTVMIVKQKAIKNVPDFA